VSKLIIKNGLVFDPINDIQGEIKDILVEQGKIVESFTDQNKIQTINAKGKTIIPAAIDMHTHVASQQVNWIRLLGSENKDFMSYWKGLTLNKIALDYISNGYTFILEANVFPSLAKHTIFNFQQIPCLDKGMLLNASNLWPLELEFQRGKIDDMSILLSDLLAKTYSFGLKVYNPFESESWNFKNLREDITENGRLYNFSALDVYENLTKSNEYLGLPHSLHAHIEGYETEKAKKNLMLITEKINGLDLTPKVNRSQILHLAHASAYNIDGNNTELINLINNTNKIDLDLGFLCFNPINPLITSDRRLINKITATNESGQPFKLIRSAVEIEGDSFATIHVFDKKNKVYSKLWSNALDLALNIANKWQVQLSVNYPNYGDINNIPEIATWLMSTKARSEFQRDLSPEISQQEGILSFNEFVIVSRAAPAKSLGLGNIKGNLGKGADADLNILNIDLQEIDPSDNYDALQKALTNIEYVIKAGEIIKNGDNINLESEGKILWAEGSIKKRTNRLL